MRLVPEKAVNFSIRCQLYAQALEIIPERVGIKASRVKNLACICRNLPVMNIILQKQAYLFAAEIFAYAPRVGNSAQSGFMSRFDYIVDIWEPKVHIKFSDCQNDRVTPVISHFLKIRFGVLDIIEAVIAHSRVLNRHFSHLRFIIAILLKYQKAILL